MSCLNSCLDCFCTWSCSLLPQKCCYLCLPCIRPPHLRVERWLPKPGGSQVRAAVTSLKVLTYNIRQLLHFQDNSAAFKIGQHIAKSDFDVVCLCELFDETSRQIVSRELQASGKFYAAVTRAGCEKGWGLGEDSGLYLASRYRILSAEFEAYKDYTGSDALANKGVLLVTLEVPTGTGTGMTTMSVALTHLQAFAAGAAVRLKQLGQAIDLCRRDAARTCDKTYVLCGDLNVTDVSGAERAGFTGDRNPFGSTKEFPPFAKMIKDNYPDAVDCYRSRHLDMQADPGYTFDAILNKMPLFDEKREKMIKHETAPEQERLDYMWLLTPNSGNTTLTCTEAEIDQQNDLSDHFGIAITIEFAKKK
jgi:endonuclease/exonuclease/phosphatase family metal-dependent hydrolase